MSLLSKTLKTIKKALGLQDELEIAFNLAALFVQKIEDSTLTGAEKLAWVKEQLELQLPRLAPKVWAKWSANWPKINAFINALVALANVAGIFAKAVR